MGLSPTFFVIREITASLGKDRIGTIVSVGVAYMRDIPPTSFLSGIGKHATDAMNMEEYLIQYSHESYFRFKDLEGCDVGIYEWVPSGITTRVSESGIQTMEKMHKAFSKWASQEVVISQMRDCAQRLVAQRRKRAEDADRWKRYTTDV